MAAPLGGMFSGQPPGHPGDSRGQASLLQAAPGPPRTSNSTLVDELEFSFEVRWDWGVCVHSLPSFLKHKLRLGSCLFQRCPHQAYESGNRLRERKSLALVSTLSGDRHSAQVCWHRCKLYVSGSTWAWSLPIPSFGTRLGSQSVVSVPSFFEPWAL